MKKVITENEKLQLLGLVTLGRQHYKVVDQVQDSINKIIEDDGSWQINDAVWDYDVDFDQALKSMGIEITE